MTKKTIVFDANILIDLVNCEKGLLPLLSEEYNIVIPDLILNEVNGLDKREAEEYGLLVTETSLEMIEKSRKRLAGCSFQDSVCFHMARENRWICATNDKRLGRECRKAKVEVMRSFRMLIMLVEGNVIHEQKAVTIAKKMVEINPQLTDDVLEDFFKKLAGK